MMIQNDMERFENATKSGSHYNAAVPGRVLLVVRTNEGCFYFGSRLTFMVWIWVMLGFVVVPTSSMSALSAFQVPATNLRSSRWYPSSSPTLSPTLTRSATRTTSTVLLHQVSDASSSIEDNDKASNKPKPKRPNQQQQRRDRVSIPSLRDWATSEAIGIKLAPSSRVFLEANEGSGIGWYFTPTTTTNTTTSETKNQNSVLVSVPSTIPLTVECPGEGPDDTTVFSSLLQQQNGGMEKETNEEWLALPWYVQMALYLVKLDRVDSTKKGKQNTGARAIDYRPWLDSLPRQFDTPLHWPTATLENDLQYTHMTLAVTRQRKQWQRHFTKVTKLLSQTQSNGTRTAASTPCITWDDFCWGSECARSRAFAGTYTGQAFQLPIYAFTLLLVTVYVGLGLGSLEQAANGAGLVVAASILKDFVLPKFGKTKRYVICPMIDMANHKSPGWDTTFTAGEVAFEYFSNAYSLAGDVASSLTSSSSEKTDHRQLYISYGSRSNDQLLQYYGFVETNNPHDVYIMPALRTWDIGALEVACGRSFAPGRLEKLDRAGLLGRATNEAEEDYSDIDGDESAARVMKNNANGGVVLNRSVGIDPAVLQALRALVSTDKEWDAAGQAIGNFSTENSGGFSNEQCARLVGRIAIEMELASKATTLEQDEELLQRMNLMKSLDSNPSERLAIQFRIEKKKLLREAIARLT